MTVSLRTKQLILLAVAAAALSGAAILYSPLETRARKFEIVVPGQTTAVSSPLQTLLTLAPGGLRAPIVAFLWIRVEELKEKGRFHEMRDLSDWICRFMPRYPGVWGYHAWNMAWNVSVMAHQKDERWRWVESGINLLRDRAIPLNPKSLPLYKELGWVFLSKLGHDIDDYHMVYKQRWAERMQHLLGAPPYMPADSAIEAFQPIAGAPLDRDPYRAREGTHRGNHRRGLPHDGDPQWDPDDSAIQRDKLAELLEQDPAVAEYSQLLAEHGVKIDESLLEAYNRYSRDEAVEIVRRRPPQLKSDVDRALSKLINVNVPDEAPGEAGRRKAQRDRDKRLARGRDGALAFVRAQVLWNVYRMDPQHMLEMMKKYGPLDWRVVQTHGLYWITLGRKVCGEIIGKDDALNIDRNLLNCLKDLMWGGRLTYAENPAPPPSDPAPTKMRDWSPLLTWTADWRFIEPTHQAHIELANIAIAIEGGVGGRTFDTSKFKTGHTNFLSLAIQMLYAGGRWEKASYYYRWLKKEYKLSGGLWDLPLSRYVIEDIRKDGRPSPALARSQITAAIIRAYEHYAFGDLERYKRSRDYAGRVYRFYQSGSPERLKLQPWERVEAAIVAPMLVRPQIMGLYLNISARRRIYDCLDVKTQLELYPHIATPLRLVCERADPPRDFAETFPAPPGLKEHLRQRR